MSKAILRRVMKNAWRLARTGQRKYGGKVSDYLAESLKIVWANTKKSELYGSMEAREIRYVRKGNVTEKQEKFINDLLQQLGDMIFDREAVQDIKNCSTKRDASSIIDWLIGKVRALKWA